MKLNSTLVLILFAAITTLLAACGGGGGGGGAAATETAQQPVNPVLPPLPVPEPNPLPVPPAPVVSYLTLTAANYSDYGVLFNRSLATEAADIRTAYHQPSNDAARLAQALWLRPEAARQIRAAILAVLPSSAGTHTCSGGGSMTRTTAAGPTEQLVFSNCIIGGVTASGSATYRVTATTPALLVELSYSNLTAVTASATYRVNGSRNLTINTADGLDLASTVTSALVTSTQTVSATTASTLQVGYSSRYIETGGVWSIRSEGGLQLAVGNDIANLNITQAAPFSGTFSGTVYQSPSSGSYSILWNGTQKLATACGSTGLLTISFDSDNNGTVEASFARSWGTLSIPD